MTALSVTSGCEAEIGGLTHRDGLPLKEKHWRDGRVAEGAPLLREYGVNSSIEGSNPSLSAIKKSSPRELFIMLNN
jgi:hypothetical protein